MSAWILWLLVAANTADGAYRGGLLEVNHRHNANGSEAFVQVIVWDWSPDYRRYDAQAWVMIEDWHWDGQRLIARAEGGRPLEFRGRLFRETWTLVDPEVENRILFKERYRRKVW